MSPRYLLRRAINGDRRFVPGYEVVISGLRFRVEQGHKGPADLVLLWFTPTGWRRIEMAAGALMADFFYENEHGLYPPPHYLGGEKYRDFLKHAMQHGWEKADAGLKSEKQLKQERLFGEVS
jgi:hypothetical protein